MCGILGACCGNASKACNCCSLRTFALSWLGISIIIALVQFIAGAYLSSYLGPVDTMLRDIKNKIMQLEDPTLALKYYGIVADSLATLWRGTSLLTTARGVFDSIAVVLWVVGWYKQKMLLVYIFICMMAFDFFIDFCLFIIFMAVINALYIAFFYPIALLLPFVFYGWQMLLGPYILHLLLSHAYVMSVGGDGSEKKSWMEVKETKDKAAETATEKEKERLISKSTETKTEKEKEENEKEKEIIITPDDDDDDVLAQPVEEV